MKAVSKLACCRACAGGLRGLDFLKARLPCCYGYAPPRALFAQEAAARAEIKSLMQYAQQHHVPPLSPSRASCGHFSGAAGGWKMCREDKRYAMRGRLLVRAPLQPTVIALDRFGRQERRQLHC